MTLRGTPARSRLLAGCVLILGLAPAAQAQGILNTERFQLADDVAGVHASVNLAVSGALGNTRVVNAASSGIVGYRGGRHWTRLIGGGQFLADRERRVLNDQFVQLRYSYIFTPATRTFHFLQYQSSRTLLLTDRWLVGSGARTAVFQEGPTALHLGSGLMYEEEHRDEDRLEPEDAVRLRTVRMANQAVLTHELSGGATIVNVLYVQPSIRAFSDVRLLNDLGLRVPLTDTVNLTLTLEWRHDSRPPVALRRDDVRYRTGIAVDLR